MGSNNNIWLRSVSPNSRNKLANQQRGSGTITNSNKPMFSLGRVGVSRLANAQPVVKVAAVQENERQ